MGNGRGLDAHMADRADESVLCHCCRRDEGCNRLGGIVWEAYALRSRVRAGAGANPMRLLHMSITCLTVLFIALAVDTLLPHSWH